MASISSKSTVNQQLHISDRNSPDDEADINRPDDGADDYPDDGASEIFPVSNIEICEESSFINSRVAEEQLPSYYEVPNQRVDGFVGREDILQSIDNALSEGSGPRYAILYGMSGQGKSQVALEYCRREKGRRYSAIFWVDATTQDSAESSFHSISERIKRQTDDLSDIKAVKAFVLKTFTSWTIPWLMVFDNYDNPDNFRNIRDFIPQSEFGAILIITRRPDSTDLVIDQCSHFLQLSGLEESAAVALLVRQSQTKEVNSSVAEKVVERLGYHPLYITEAGAYIRKYKLPLHEYMHIKSAYWKDGRPEEAKALEVQVLRLKRRVLGLEHPDTLTSIANLASICSNNGQLKEAEELGLQVMDSRKRVLGSEHPDTLTSISHLASTYRSQARWDEAKELEEQVIEFRKKVTVLENPGMGPASRLLQVPFMEYSPSYGGSAVFDSANPIQIERLAEEQQELKSVSNNTRDLWQSTENTQNPELGEIRPLVSDDEDISPQVRIKASPQKAITERQLAAMMAHHPDLDMAYNEAMALMPADRFVANFSRLLRRFYLDIRPIASTSLERTAVESIRSRGSRMRLASIISNTRNSKRIEIDARTEEDIRIAHQKDRTEMESWIKAIANVRTCYRVAMDINVLSEARENSKEKGEPDEAEDTATKSSCSDMKIDERGEFPNIQLDIQQVADFLTGSDAFRALSHNFGISVLPRSLSQLALSIPPNQIRFSNYNDVSLSNKIKTFMEEHTGAQWNWWPLSPRKQLLGSNQIRMHWQCLCGKHLWTEMSKSQSIIFQKLSKNNISQPSQIPLCSKVRKNGVKTSVAKWITNPDSASSNAHQSTPSGMSTSISALIGTTGPGPMTRPPPSAYSSPNIVANNPHTIASSNFRDNNRLWVLFGVHGGRKTLELGQICSDNSDKGFVRKLRETYRNLRGFRRVWFSFWQFHYCDFVKFEKIGKNRIISRGSELPTGPDYEYFPRPPQADNPPISHHEFNVVFYSCSKNCLFALFHDCFVLEDEQDFALRIPRRKGKFELEGSIRRDPIRFAWGIQAQYNISLLHVLTYHILMMVGPIVFWVWWQKHHPNDLQNGSIPYTVAAVLISLFWSATGILRGLREPRQA